MLIRRVNWLELYVLRAAFVALTAVLLTAGNIDAQTTARDKSLPERLSASFASVARAVEPAVVSIDAKSSVPQIPAKSSSVPSDPEDIMDLFRGQVPAKPVYSVG